MSADDIEFFISEEPPEELGQQEEMGGEPPQRRPVPHDLGPLLAVLLLAAAASLSAIAPFQRMYTIAQDGRGLDSTSYGADGWGRYQTHNRAGLSGIPSGVHETRYGIPLVICAGLLALLGGGLLIALLLRSRDTRRRAVGLGVPIALVAGAAIAGVTAGMWLQVQAMFDTLHAQLDDVGQGFSGSPAIDTGMGACVWLSLAGGAAGLLAAAVLWFAARAESAPEQEPGKLA